MQCRFVRLIVADREPLQILVDNPGRYLRFKSQLKSFYELESDEADPDLPVISLDEVEATFAIPAPAAASPADYRKKLTRLLRLSRFPGALRHR